MQAPMTRRTLAALAATWALAGGARAQGADPHKALLMYKGGDRDKRLLDRARQEGTVSVYTSLAPTEGQPLAEAFEARYGVKVQMWRGLSEAVVQRTLSESRGRRHAVDVIETNGPEMESLAREQLLTEFHSPHLADLPANVIPAHRQWIPDRLNLFVVAYNTKKVRAEDLPRTYEGFLDPKWRRRIALEATDSEWMGGVVKAWGEPRGMEFFRKLAEMKPEMRKGHVLLAQLIAAGEIDVGLTAYYANAASAKRRGASIDWAAVEPTIARPQGIGIARQAPHPNAALLFADFILSPEAQGMLSGMGRVPVSRAVKTDTSALNYVMSDPAVILDENDKWQQLWDKLFLSK
jgi:iron(III) transport system substrate-binding protein